MPAGRPSKYTPDLAEKICTIISTSERGVHSVAKEVGIDPVTILNWFKDYPEFFTKYTRAKELQMEFMAEKIVEISDDSSNDTTVIHSKNGEPIEVENKEWLNRSRLRVDTRKWLMSKLMPKKYGDKLDVTSDGEKLESGERTYTVIIPPKE